jgi:SAM-dependent methyltransferase
MNPLERVHEAYIHGRRIRRLGEILSALIPSGSSLLDVGCGDGKLAQLLLEKRDDLQIEGVDVLVRKKAGLPVKLFDGTNLPYPASSFDGVMLIDVLHHTRDPLPLLQEALRVSRRFLIVKDHMLEGTGAAVRLRFMDYVGNARHGVSLPYNYLGPEGWAALRQALDVQVTTELQDLHLYPWPMDYVFGARLHFAALWQRAARQQRSSLPTTP